MQPRSQRRELAFPVNLAPPVAGKIQMTTPVRRFSVIKAALPFGVHWPFPLVYKTNSIASVLRTLRLSGLRGNSVAGDSRRDVANSEQLAAGTVPHRPFFRPMLPMKVAAIQPLAREDHRSG